MCVAVGMHRNTPLFIVLVSGLATLAGLVLWAAQDCPTCREYSLPRTVAPANRSPSGP